MKVVNGRMKDASSDLIGTGVSSMEAWKLRDVRDRPSINAQDPMPTLASYSSKLDT